MADEDTRLVYVVDGPGEALRLTWTDVTGRAHSKVLDLRHAAQLAADLSRGVAKRLQRAAAPPLVDPALVDWEHHVVKTKPGDINRVVDPNNRWPFTGHRTMGQVIRDEGASGGITLGDPP